MKEVTRTIIDGIKSDVEEIIPVDELIKKLPLDKKTSIEYLLIDEISESIMASYFLRGHKIIGVAYPFRRYPEKNN